MDKIQSNERNTIGNGILSRFVRELPNRSRKLLREELQERIPGHNKAQFYNWTNGKTNVPEYLHNEIEKACGIVLQDHLENMLLGIESQDYFINIFRKNMDKNQDQNQTTVFKEMAAMGIRTQKELAEKLEIAPQTLSRIINKDFTGLSWRTVKTISSFFGKAPEEFEEFSQ